MPKELLQGESLVQPPVRQHWIVLVRDMRWPTAIFLLAAFLVDVVLSGGLGADVRALITLLLIAAYILVGLIAREAWRASSLMITDQRVIVELGIIRKTTQVIPLDRVQDLLTQQGLLGQWLDYGHIEVDTAGSRANQAFRYAAHPQQLREQMFQLSEALRRSV